MLFRAAVVVLGWTSFTQAILTRCRDAYWTKTCTINENRDCTVTASCPEGLVAVRVSGGATTTLGETLSSGMVTWDCYDRLGGGGAAECIYKIGCQADVTTVVGKVDFECCAEDEPDGVDSTSGCFVVESSDSCQNSGCSASAQCPAGKTLVGGSGEAGGQAVLFGEVVFTGCRFRTASSGAGYVHCVTQEKANGQVDRSHEVFAYAMCC